MQERKQIEEAFKHISFGPLNGVIVAEIGQHVSGPMAAEELARKGALVIKLEQATGDPARVYLSPSIFASLNAGKMSVVIPKNDTTLYVNILESVDVIIDNRAPIAKENDTVLQNCLKASNKKRSVIFCSIVGYDSEEHKDQVALDAAVQAATGMGRTNAPTPDAPLKVGFTVIDIATAFQAASSITAHLFYLKNNPVQGLVVNLEVSMAKVSAQLQTGQMLKYLQEKKEPDRQGNKDLFLSPFSFYTTNE